MNELSDKFLARKPGYLQNKAKQLSEELGETRGGLAIDEVAKLGRHVGQLILETQKHGLNLVSSYDNAVPVFSETSKIARKISAQKGLDPVAQVDSPDKNQIS